MGCIWATSGASGPVERAVLRPIRPRHTLPEFPLSIPANLGMNPSETPSGSIAGSVLPIRRAEELIATLQGVLSVRIVPNDYGSIDEIHVLTTSEVLPKQTVRNIESALMAQLGWRVNHRKISIATTLDPERAADIPPRSGDAAPERSEHAGGSLEASSARVQQLYGSPSTVSVPRGASSSGGESAPLADRGGQPTGRLSTSHPQRGAGDTATDSADRSSVSLGDVPSRGRSSDVGAAVPYARRTILFEDVEVRRSRTTGVMCRVTLRRDGQQYIGEAEGHDSERSRIEVAARAAVSALLQSSHVSAGRRTLALEGAKLITAFDRDYVFVSLAARAGRDAMVLTGSCEVRDSSETSAVLAILDATNRWINLD